jgi:UDP-glucose 4-epimerase
MSSVVFRYFNVAGATTLRGEDHNPETHVIPVALQVAAGKRSHFSIFGDDYDTPDGTALRDYVHVSDLVDAHLLALDRLDRPLGVFNLGGREGISVRQIVDAVNAVTGRQITVRIEPRRAGDAAVLVADANRAITELGWSPSRSTLEQMIGSAWDWMRFFPRGYAGF